MASLRCRQTLKVALAELMRSGTALHRTGYTASKTRSCWELFSHFSSWVMPKLRSPVDLSCFCSRLACLKNVPSRALGFWNVLLAWHSVTQRPGFAPVCAGACAGKPLGAWGTGEGRVLPGLGCRAKSEWGSVLCWAWGQLLVGAFVLPSAGALSGTLGTTWTRGVFTNCVLNWDRKQKF